MEKILEKCILEELKRAGYQKLNTKALYMFTQTTIAQIKTNCNILSSLTLHSMRSRSTLLDVMNLIKLTKIDYSNVYNRPTVKYEVEEEPKPIQFKSSISCSAEKFIHIYDFMPDFPPVHTFKKSFLKENRSEDKSEKVKQRIEQSLKTESSLLKIIACSKGLPKRINFLFD
ncbi:putative subunit 8 of transcription factor IID [Hamiltosporidium magnivora]|uniref:Putative subunit 8 of transcription factor IID n=1 Tax=Hamiltosporidium magnivora TaxID=148818 RepID=A0A4Q9LGS0_9MICR|nr:putative subunit 8 of transcription factor IID [Hamiltosporidium magnivora]